MKRPLTPPFVAGTPVAKGLAKADSRFVVLRDQSSSMEWIPEFPRIWNQQIVTLGKLLPHVRVTMYSVSAEIEKIEDDTALNELPPLDESTWHYGKTGILRGGSALGDGIIRGCQKVKQLRRRGYTGPLGLFLLTDGWSKSDRKPISLARSWLEHVREEYDITFRVFGFLREETREELLEFAKELGAETSELHLTVFANDSQREEIIRTSLERLGEELFSTRMEQLSPSKAKL